MVHPADVSTTDKEKRRKTDKVDALKLARKHASHDLKAIHVPDENTQKERALIRQRKRLVGDINRSINRLKSELRFQGIEIPKEFARTVWSNKFADWVEQQAKQDLFLQNVLLLMMEQIKLLRQLLLKIEKEVREMMRNEKYNHRSKLLLGVPGVGPVVSSQFLLEIGDVRRFGPFDRLNDYVGFCPDTDSSGNTERDTGITKRRHKQLRTNLIEAAWTATRQDPAMLEAYTALTKRMSGKKALVRIARKLLRRMRAVLITGIPYQKGIVA